MTWGWGGGSWGTHQTEAWGWRPLRTVRCTANRPAGCSAAPESGRGAGGDAGCGDRGREGNKERETKRDGLGDGQRWERRAGRVGRPRAGRGERLSGGDSGDPRTLSPTHPEPHRDERGAPAPQLGQQAVRQAHTLLDTGADLHSERHIQHLQGQSVWAAELLAGRGRQKGTLLVPGSCPAQSAGTWPCGSLVRSRRPGETASWDPCHSTCTCTHPSPIPHTLPPGSAPHCADGETKAATPLPSCTQGQWGSQR